VRRPVPHLGSATDPREHVESFYDFWFNKFESWRDFSHHDEYDLKDADSRDERRWMERNNLRIRKKRQNEEHERIVRLVETSYRLDPRVKLIREEDNLKANAEKRERQMAKEMKDKEENDRIAAAELERANSERAAQETATRLKEEKIEIKRMRAVIRQTLKASAPEGQSLGLSDDRLIEILLILCKDLPTTNDLLKRAEAAVKNNTVTDLLNEFAKEALPNQSIKIGVPTPVTAAPTVTTDWAPEELTMLARGLQKFPGGTARRWDAIAAFIRTRSATEVLEMAKKCSDGASLKSMGSQLSADAFDQFQKAAKAKTTREIDAPADERLERSVSKGVEDWSPDQQKEFEVALKKYPGTLPPNERWDSISQEVNGKTRQQCVARFKYIRELLSSKKN